MESSPRSLPIPEAVTRDTRAIEILRAWASGGKQHVAINTALWKDPAAWGIMLVDLAKHIANAYELAGTMDTEDALSRIKDGLMAEWSEASDEPTGELMT